MKNITIGTFLFNFFFWTLLFTSILAIRYYEDAYGIAPFFKAGVNIGSVMAAEVGLARREIAYHGDVLNTAARIQSLCNKYEAALLCSEMVVNNLLNAGDYELSEKEEIVLRGKTEAVKVFEVKRKVGISSI